MNIQVTIDITAVEFRPLTSLEWAVLSLVNHFAPTPPSLEEATQELRLHEPAFLRSAFQDMCNAGAFESRLPDGALHDLADARLSETGREILGSNGMEVGEKMTYNRDVVIDWPSGRPLPAHESKQAEISPAPGVSLEEIEQRLDPTALEEWLSAGTSIRSRILEFLVVDP
ncbi:MAG: hypothetical protein RL514_4252 [Verrucomicrobiota bacterium]|jgi:hypothetical protein